MNFNSVRKSSVLTSDLKTEKWFCCCNVLLREQQPPSILLHLQETHACRFTLKMPALAEGYMRTLWKWSECLRTTVILTPFWSTDRKARRRTTTCWSGWSLSFSAATGFSAKITRFTKKIH